MSLPSRFAVACLTVSIAVVLGMARRGFAEEVDAEGLRLLKAGTVEGTTALAPAPATEEDPSVHLNTATLLFYKGAGLLRNGKKEEGEAVFKDVAQELVTAIRLSEHDANAHRRNLLRSQCAYLLGDIYVSVFPHPATARALYQESIRYVPDHAAATGVFQRLQLLETGNGQKTGAH